MARIRSRGHTQILRAAPARSRHDQGGPTEDHCRWDGLALPERPQTRAEGINATKGGMPMTHTRRRFLAAVSIAGVTGAVGGRQVLAAEEGLETTSVRLANSGLCIAPQYVAEGLLRSEGFTDVRYIDTTTPERKEKIARREIDFSLDYASSFIPA